PGLGRSLPQLPPPVCPGRRSTSADPRDFRPRNEVGLCRVRKRRLPSSDGDAMNPSNQVTELRTGSAGWWLRPRVTFGPLLVGLVGGALTGLTALTSVAGVCRNMG